MDRVEALNPRHSWRAAHTRWLEEDHALKARGSEQAYKMKRALLMPPKLDGRQDRMLRRVVSNAHLVQSLERRGVNGPEWLHGDARLSRAQWQLRDAVRTLLRFSRRPVEHPKGGLYADTKELRPLLRRFLNGEDDDITFLRQMGWALRLLTREAHPDEEH